ncbi:MAG TPA: cation-transporting P-type ATPase [Cellulomonas sp.]|uniref:cation-translocating P-type ATPase n=1 Tax=Cellulomonas sp. TaxID=40001 RepID=UPI002E31F692|nr:cation-transporting P-type ATPase [Cellulomonas sp.]HEX5331067.1 cation-transporting P-type ATPase [Cellulomonas sp.]
MGYRSGSGLTSVEAAVRLATDGPNLMPEPARPHPLRELARQMVSFFAVMLWVAAGLALVAGMPALAVAIAVVVVINGVFAFAQEYRADRAAERLRDLLPAHATVRRDGRAQVVDAADLVVGDVVILEAGDRVSADLTLEPGGQVGVDESMLTGESATRTRDAGSDLLAGTYVVEGHGEAVVRATGVATRLAGISAVTQSAVRPRSPLARQLHRVVRVVALVAIGVGVVFFVTALLLGRTGNESFLFAIGVTVALVPEGLLPTVTLSLARAAQRMAVRHALVRRLEAVETLGLTTYICTDKTGTLTRNQMSVVHAWTPAGVVDVVGLGYAPTATLDGSPAALDALRLAASSAARCSPDAHAAQHGDDWAPVGDPMDVAIHVLASRVDAPPAPERTARHPFDPRRRRSSVVDPDGVHVVGASDSVLPLCHDVPGAADDAVTAMASRGLRVVAVAVRAAGTGNVAGRAADVERDLRLLGLLGLEDPPRDDVADAIASCRSGGIRIAMVTGDHPVTALTIAREVGLVRGEALVVEGKDLPADDAALGELLDRDEVVVARVAPEDKLRIARALQSRGHVVAMTGDGVNDGPALRTADVGIAMGASGTDVAREAADLVLLDDHFGSIVAAVELGRSTFANIRKFLTYHLTDNVAELTPFVVWALSGGSIPLALTVLQVLALDIGTDLLPALALGAERPSKRTMSGPFRLGSLIDRRVLRRAFGVLGPTESLVSMVAFVVTLRLGGWSVGADPGPQLLAAASGTAFAAIVLGQLANAFACRSESRWIGATGFTGNRLLQLAVAAEAAVLIVYLVVPPLSRLLGGTLPAATGWLLALLAIPAVWTVDAADKWLRRRSRSVPAMRRPTQPDSRSWRHLDRV